METSVNQTFLLHFINNDVRSSNDLHESSWGADIANNYEYVNTSDNVLIETVKKRPGENVFDDNEDSKRRRCVDEFLQVNHNNGNQEQTTSDPDILETFLKKSRVKHHRDERNDAIEEHLKEIKVQDNDIENIEYQVGDAKTYLKGLLMTGRDSSSHEYSKRFEQLVLLQRLQSHKIGVDMDLKKSSWNKEYEKRLKKIPEVQREYIESLQDELAEVNKIIQNFEINTSTILRNIKKILV